MKRLHGKILKIICVICVFAALFEIALTSSAQNKLTVCIDPGHPSERDSGKAVVNGVREVDLNWEVALKLKKALEAEGVRVVLTKKSKLQKVANKRRAEIANNANAALFFRIHCDRGWGRGMACYYPNRKGKKGKMVGPSEKVMEQSKEAARIICPEIAGEVSPPLHNNGIMGDSATAVGKEQGALTGSIFSKVPTLLVEMVDLTHKDDVKFIKHPANQDKMVRGMKKGILRFLNVEL